MGKFWAVGFEAEVRPDWEKYTPEFKAPANYKDQLKKDEYVVDAKRRFTEKAKLLMLTGSLRRIFLRCSDGVFVQPPPGEALKAIFLATVATVETAGVVLVPRLTYFTGLLMAAAVDGEFANLPEWRRLLRDDKVVDPLDHLLSGEDVYPQFMRRFGIVPPDTQDTAEWWASVGVLVGQKLGYGR